MQGKITIQGSKNASFATIAASLLTTKKCIIQNVPDIADVRVFLEILKSLGSEYEFRDNQLVIDNTDLHLADLPRDLVRKLRGSVLLAGPLLARFGSVTLPSTGGDALGSRPIDIHLDGFKKLGAICSATNQGVNISGAKLFGTKIVLPISSVTGTENLILAAVLADGNTEIRLAACEPHVQALCMMLNQMGAKIFGIGTPNLLIQGVRELFGTTFRLPADEIVAVTFFIAAAVTHGELEVNGLNIEDLDAPLAIMERTKVNVEYGHGWVKIHPPQSDYQATKIVTGVFPQLLTDDQPLFGVLATQSVGETSIHDWVHEGRLGYLPALQDMGAKVEIRGIHRARIHGPTQLHGAEIKSIDLRAGASVLVASLVAQGQSIIYNAEMIDRGYERIDENLKKLGADIHRVD